MLFPGTYKNFVYSGRSFHQNCFEKTGEVSIFSKTISSVQGPLTGILFAWKSYSNKFHRHLAFSIFYSNWREAGTILLSYGKCLLFIPFPFIPLDFETAVRREFSVSCRTESSYLPTLIWNTCLPSWPAYTYNLILIVIACRVYSCVESLHRGTERQKRVPVLSRSLLKIPQPGFRNIFFPPAA